MATGEARSLTGEELDELVDNLRAALAHSEAAAAEAGKRCADEIEQRQLREKRVRVLEAGKARLAKELELAKRQHGQAQRQATMAGILSDRQAAALKQLVAENSELLGILSGLPSLRSAIANHVVAQEDLSHLTKI